MSSDLGPPRKRARVEEDADADADPVNTADVQKDEQVWFSDGNVVVVAANKVAFKVHKGILSLRSEVFRDLFSLANADAESAETIDGCPVVHLTDPPEDIRHLFLVLCCGKNYYYNGDEPVPVPFSVLAALVRTAHKYAIDDVLSDALSRLKKFYTNDLAAWQDPDTRARYVAAADSDAPAAIHLARLTNTPTVLPTAFFVCTQLAEQWDYDPADGACVSRVATLSVLDRAQIAVAKGHLVKARATRAFHLLGTVPSAQCTTREACEAAQKVPLTMLAGTPCLLKSSMSDRLALTPMARTFWSRRSHFCAGCQEARREEDEMMIRLLWHHLPDLFALRIGEDSWPGGSPVDLRSYFTGRRH